MRALSLNSLFAQMHMKSFELEGLRGALRTVCEQCPADEAETRMVENRMDSSQRSLQELSQTIQRRVELAEKMSGFRKLSEELEREMTTLERKMSSTTIMIDRSSYEESRMLIQQLYLQESLSHFCYKK